ncbi:MAG: alanine--glyoxylate aminotransferase family protein [Gemmataceae bacterium]
MKKQRLLTPGPTPVPEETLLDLAKPVFYHRGAQFRQLLTEVTADLQYLFCTTNPVLTLTASGTGGMEAAVASALAPGRKAICLIAGRWGERWRNIARAMGVEVVAVTVPYGQPVAPRQLADALAQHPDAAAVCATLCETATGVKNDIAAFGKLVAATPALLLVDAISGLGCVECRTDEWQVDICVTGSQKALMLPPGLAFVSVSDKAWRVIDANPQPRAFYFDLKKYRDNLATGDTPFTPANSLIKALRTSLKMLRGEGLEKIWARYARMAAAARAGIQAMNLELFAAVPAESLTVACVPDGIDGAALLSRLEKGYGVRLAGGQDTLKGKILRLGHMGYIDAFDVLAALSALELVLLEMGHRFTPGAGVAAAQRVYAEAVPTAPGRESALPQAALTEKEPPCLVS